MPPQSSSRQFPSQYDPVPPNYQSGLHVPSGYGRVPPSQQRDYHATQDITVEDIESSSQRDYLTTQDMTVEDIEFSSSTSAYSGDDSDMSAKLELLKQQKADIWKHFAQETPSTEYGNNLNLPQRPQAAPRKMRIIMECDMCEFYNHKKSVMCIECGNPRNGRWRKIQMPGKSANALPSQEPKALPQLAQKCPVCYVEYTRDEVSLIKVKLIHFNRSSM